MSLHSVIRYLLLPISWLYGLLVWLRNRCFDLGIFKQLETAVPIVVIGNLSAGGTGKTPHLIHLAKLLQNEYKLAILSRGYGRQGKGFRWVECDDNPSLVGDEPLEIKFSLPDVAVAVDGNRRRGVHRILEELPHVPDLILLDDGFQHRWIRPSFSLIMTRWDAPFTRDQLLPSGRLRESKKEINRAQAICVSQCPDFENTSGLIAEIKKYATQEVYFSHPEYSRVKQFETVLLVTGIVHTNHLVNHLFSACSDLRHLEYRDHHSYKANDIQKILSTFKSLTGENKVLLTTKKDWVKLRRFTALSEVPLEVIDMQPKFDRAGDQKLIKQIKDHVEQHQRKS